MKIYNKTNLHTLNWDEIENGAKLEQVLKSMVTQKANVLVENASQEVQILQINQLVLPLIIAQKYHPQTTYLNSALVQYFDLAKEEIEMEFKGKRSLRAYIAPTVINFMKGIFKGLGFEKTVFVNNWLLSTNLYPSLSAEQIKESLALLKKTFPQHAIVFRSVNEYTDKDLLENLIKNGLKGIISRPLLMLDPADKGYQKKRMFKMDEKLWKKNKKYHWTDAQELSSEEITRIRDLYEALYRVKYSNYNPDYKESLIKIWLKTNFMDFKLLRQEDKIVGVTAFFKRNGILTTPFIGYDQEIPISEGLYRFLNLRLMEEAISEGLILNMSSGAAHFKRLRGGTSCLEYNVVRYHHHPWSQKIPWKIYHQVSQKIAIPAIQKYQL